ncbi:MAG: hypothetical protein NVS2B14_11380 [Chamaesiphon sp.]
MESQSFIQNGRTYYRIENPERLEALSHRYDAALFLSVECLKHPDCQIEKLITSLAKAHMALTQEWRNIGRQMPRDIQDVPILRYDTTQKAVYVPDQKVSGCEG